MKAFVYEKYGQEDVLLFQEVGKPIPKENEVLIKVNAVSINDWDWQLLKGIPFVNRLINGLFKPKRKILGSDIAGIIESVGKNVKKFKPVDEVYGDLSGEWGGFAEYVCTGENMLALKPVEMTFEQAAAIPQAAMLAVQGLIDVGKLQQNQKVLINGAGGGVGTFGIQLTKLYNAEVSGVDNSSKTDFMRSLGFDNVIDYRKEDFTKSGRLYDLVLDCKTNRSIFSYLHALKMNGIYATVGGSTIRLLQVLLLSPFIKMIYNKHVRIVPLKPNRDLEYINSLFESGKIKPVIGGEYKLEELPKALRLFADGEHKGKLVITICHDN